MNHRSPLHAGPLHGRWWVRLRAWAQARGRGARRAMPAATAAALLVAGCASQPSPIAWHTLVPAAAATVRGVAQAATLPPRDASTLALGAVQLPAEVDRPQLVLHLEGRAVLADGQRWLEPLERQLPRALALALSERLGRPVLQAVQAPSPSRRLAVEVQRFELRPGNAAVLRAVWTLPAAPASASSTVQVFEVAEPVSEDGVAASVDAMRRAVSKLADAMAAAVDPAASAMR